MLGCIFTVEYRFAWEGIPMDTKVPVRCRMAACRETLDDGKEWSFFVINDCDVPLDSVQLFAVGYEWGDYGNSEAVGGSATALAPGAAALIWRDDGSGAELRMDFSLLVHMGGREARLQFEFPKLYRKKDLPIVRGLGKPGWEEVAEA